MASPLEPTQSTASNLSGAAGSVFRTTRWTVVRLAQAGDPEAAREGMERLAQTYWYPLYAFARRQGLNEADAKDSTQVFLARMVTGSLLQSVDASKGRFRSFLLSCYKNHLADERERAQAIKRGGQVEFVRLDTSGADALYRSEPMGLNSEDHYDRDWAQSLMAEVLEKLRLECARSRKLDRFEALVLFLIDDPSTQEQAQLQNKLALGESGLRTALQRLRFRFGEYVWTEIARTVAEVEDVEEETRYLLGILSRTDAFRPLIRKN